MGLSFVGGRRQEVHTRLGIVLQNPSVWNVTPLAVDVGAVVHAVNALVRRSQPSIPVRRLGPFNADKDNYPYGCRNEVGPGCFRVLGRCRSSQV